MSGWAPVPVGSQHYDLEGKLREVSHHGVNLFVHLDDARGEARNTMVRPKSKRLPAPQFYLWRTDDGLYTWSAIPDPSTPWSVDAVLVEVGTP
jgi:hypothetical protein